MGIRWEWEDERPLCKWVDDVHSSQYKLLWTISLQTSHTFGSLLYENEDYIAKRFVCSELRTDPTMNKILGKSGTVEISAGMNVEIYLNSFGQNALDRAHLFKRVVSAMTSMGYSCKYTYEENIGALWFTIRSYPQATFEKGLATYDRILREVFSV